MRALLGTQLKDRFLWYDGESSYAPKDVVKLSRSRLIHHVTEITPEIESYNQQVQVKDMITVKGGAHVPTPTWTASHLEPLNVVSYVGQQHYARFRESADFEHRERRLADELVEFQERGLIPLIKQMIHVINTLKTHNAVWGIGRGSSVSSYVLFVIGVHDVDSYLYDLSFTDFID